MTSETNEQHRTTMSIGELLAVLRPEFSDVTVSKLRFLESAGLVHPERSASGYRQFTEDDVARLRFVLRAQRDQFLPLRVIRQRLEELEASGLLHAHMSSRAFLESQGAAEGVTDGSMASGEGLSLGVSTADPEPSSATEHASAEPASLVSSPGAARDSAVAPTAPGSDPQADHQEPEAGGRTGQELQMRLESAADEGEAANTAPTPLAPSHGEAPSVVEETSSAGAERLRRGSGEPVTGATGRPAHWLSAALDGRLTRDELCRSAHAEASVLTELESFGLVQEDPTGGREPYREGDRDVLAAAQELATFGLSARHLRMYKSLVDRESALFAQVVSAQRGRGTPGRQQARGRLERLAELGGALRNALLANALRDVLGSAGLGSEDGDTDGEPESASLP